MNNKLFLSANNDKCITWFHSVEYISGITLCPIKADVNGIVTGLADVGVESEVLEIVKG